jgi:hypothetical protein
MKFFIAAFFSVSAIACPNLAGSYPSCTGEVSNLVIAQSGNEFTVSQVSDGIRMEDVIVADGVVTEVDDDGETYFESAFCRDDKLVVVTTNASNSVNVTSTIWKEGNTIVSQSVGVDLGETFNESIRCQ